MTHIGNLCDMKSITPLQKCVTQFDQVSYVIVLYVMDIVPLLFYDVSWYQW